LLCFVFGFLLYFEATFASETNLDSIIFRGIDFIHQDKFEEGISEFTKVVEKYPDDPAGYFFIAASLQTLIDDYRNEKYKADFEKNIDLAIEKGYEKVEKDPNSAIDHFYLGGSLGYRGIYRSFRGSWWGAFRDGGKAHSHLKQAVELDSTLYDAYFGLGAYHYWRSVKSKLFWWLPFFGDERKKGIQETMIAIQKGKYAKDEAAYSLLRIYLEEKDSPAVLKWSQEVKRINENDPFRLWMTGFAYIGLDNWIEAKDIFLELLNVLKSSSYYDPAAEYECRYWLAYVNYNLGDLESAKEELNQTLKLEPDVKGNDYAEPFVDKVRDLQKEISRKMKSK
jgi:tetratricopeptide (TPR) repeat protein